MADLAELPVRLQRRRVHGRVHAGRDAVFGHDAADLRHERAVGERERVRRGDADLSIRRVRRLLPVR